MKRSLFSMLAIGLCLFDGNIVLAQNNGGAATNTAAANTGVTPVVQSSMFPATNGTGAPANGAAVAKGNTNQSVGNSAATAAGGNAATNVPSGNTSQFAPGGTRPMFSPATGTQFSNNANSNVNNYQATNGVYNFPNSSMFNSSQYGNSPNTTGGMNNARFTPSANNSQYVGPSVSFNAQSSPGVTSVPALGNTPARKYAVANSNNAGSYYGLNPYYAYGNSTNPYLIGGNVVGFPTPGIGTNVNYGTFPIGTNLNATYGLNRNTQAGLPFTVSNTPMPGLGNSAAVNGGVSQGASNGQAQSGAASSAGAGASTGGGSAAAGAGGAAGGH